MISSSLLVLVSLGAFAQQNRAQEKPDPESRAKQMTDRMAEQLQLTEEQKAKILDINREFAKKQEAEREARKTEMEARKKEGQDHLNKISSVLTEEQRQKWQEIRDHQMDRRRPGGEVHHRGDFPKRKRDGN